MSEELGANAQAVDFALVAYREDGAWQLEQVADDTTLDVTRLVAELPRWPGKGGVLGLVSVDEDFFLIVRVLGPQTRLLLSDVTAATDWPIARSAVDVLDIPLPDDEDDAVPAGDLGIVADLGMGAMDMGAVIDEDLFPDEMLGDIAEALGFGTLYDDLLGVAAH